jgi:hypothetical protein
MDLEALPSTVDEATKRDSRKIGGAAVQSTVMVENQYVARVPGEFDSSTDGDNCNRSQALSLQARRP